jgi:hypothetical protein
MANKKYRKMTEGEALYSIGCRAEIRDGVKGMTIPLKGKDGKPVFIPASDEKPEMIVGSSHKQFSVAGSKAFKCVDCRHDVWISPSTQKILVKYPGTPVICTDCLLKRGGKTCP